MDDFFLSEVYFFRFSDCILPSTHLYVEHMSVKQVWLRYSGDEEDQARQQDTCTGPQYQKNWRKTSSTRSRRISWPNGHACAIVVDVLQNMKSEKPRTRSIYKFTVRAMANSGTAATFSNRLGAMAWELESCRRALLSAILHKQEVMLLLWHSMHWWRWQVLLVSMAYQAKLTIANHVEHRREST